MGARSGGFEAAVVDSGKALLNREPRKISYPNVANISSNASTNLQAVRAEVNDGANIYALVGALVFYLLWVILFYKKLIFSSLTEDLNLNEK